MLKVLLNTNQPNPTAGINCPSILVQLLQFVFFQHVIFVC